MKRKDKVKYFSKAMRCIFITQMHRNYFEKILDMLVESSYPTAGRYIAERRLLAYTKRPYDFVKSGDELVDIIHQFYMAMAWAANGNTVGTPDE